ncbi:polyamine aminopropyltransferase [Sulfurisphaera tokodaii]|uniref:Polyamine aminopropyltransferase n=2 Tax=Sulfurisphaera tokodaii TaxID=111955 RepID=SPEE_SULTO|nr:polyamine aminopropyltransferase [Sulfurisphaera tokodaii]Q975S5.1 RecName: Full=Polyamine aminopropyltransferase; AltName: Full=Putrescine aminopropyltransferase; Short=PAPT; AltName: Full=Spermidine synthase; Short=SPDS; Short=SPDSY [Sulfurisphaera tokodaii str. 7]BAB65325.1 spermidine synthase [Sulfurisphaera tokodaii str. 7]HII74977.1 polyamine aminopropyltransferase [Sulfurisphaera tokodaii]
MYEWHWHIEWQTPYEFHGHAITKVIAEEKTPYQRALLVELARFGKALILDGKIQSTITDEFIYHEALVHPLLLSINNPEKILILGGGEGATLREVLKHKTIKNVTMVDIDPVVIDFAKKYLQEWHQGAFDNPKSKLVIEDGYKFIKETKEKFDAVVIDLTDPIKDSPSQMLYTKEFYEEVKRISKWGIVTQATSPSFSLETFSIIYNTIKHVFKKVSAGITYVPAFDGLWGFVYASDEVNPAEFSKEEINNRIKERIDGSLRFYDGETHITMFSIPKHIREVLEKENKISTRENPVAVPA